MRTSTGFIAAASTLERRSAPSAGSGIATRPSSGTAPWSRRIAARIGADTTIRRPHGRRRDRLRRAGPRALRDPGLAHRRGADARLHERRGARRDAPHRRAAPLEPLPRRALAQGRDVGQHPGRPGDPLRLRRRRAARARRARRPRLPHRRAHLLPPRRARAARRRTRCCPALERTIADRAASAPDGLLHRRSCSPTRRSSARRSRRRPRRSPAPRARRPTSASPRRPPTCSTTSPCCCAAAGSRSRTPRRCSVPVAAESELPARRPSARRLDEVRALAAEHNLVPVRQTFLEDCETPVSAFLKLRGAGPGVPARVRRAGPARRALVVHRLPPAPRAPLDARRTAATPTRSRPPRSSATARRRCPACRRSPAARSASSATTASAPSSRSASRTRTRSACRTSR